MKGHIRPESSSYQKLRHKLLTTALGTATAAAATAGRPTAAAEIAKGSILQKQQALNHHHHHHLGIALAKFRSSTSLY